MLTTICGIDPGTQYLGYGFIAVNADGDFSHVKHGVLNVPLRLNFAQKLNYLHENLSALFQLYKPQEVVVEKVFLGKNTDSAFKLGHARGVCLQVAAQHNCETYEYAARSVKKQITGQGGASKEHVRLIVLNMLKMKTEAHLDATDALAMAVSHVQFKQTAKLLSQTTRMVEL